MAMTEASSSPRPATATVSGAIAEPEQAAWMAEDLADDPFVVGEHPQHPWRMFCVKKSHEW